MDLLRTLLLQRAHVVVLDADRAAAAATRPARDSDADKLEDELAQLGFVMSLDLAMAVRRLPHPAVQELRGWLVDTLAKTTGAHRPHVPLFRQFPAGTPGDTHGLYLRRILTWLATQPDQPCPWCGEVTSVGALDPCGHLVCRTCWDGGNYTGCPICHRRVALGNAFVRPAPASGDHRGQVARHPGELRLLHLSFDLLGTTRGRFERLLSRQTPLSPEDRAEIEAVIDRLGPRAAAWLPRSIAVRESMAIAVARLWMISPDRAAILQATSEHLRTATDVLRVAVVLLGGDASLVEPMRLRSIGRGLRRTVLEALDRLPAAQLVEDVLRHAGLWKRVGERLHPYEHAHRLSTAALAFAIVRGTRVSTSSFGDVLRAEIATLPRARVDGDRVRVSRWAHAIEGGLRAGEVRTVARELATRPGELLRRADHLVRVTQARHPEALTDVLEAIRRSVTRGAPATLLTLASHVAQRAQPWPRRVFFPRGELLKAWGAADHRAPLCADAIGAIVGDVRTELVARAQRRRTFARAVIDRGLVDLLVPSGERRASRAKVAWPRGSELPLPDGDRLRLFLHWEQPPTARVDLDLSVALFDATWRHVGTCDFTNLVVGASRAAVHSGDLTSAPPPLGASEFVDLDRAALHALGAHHAVMVVFSYNAVSFDRLAHGFAGLMRRPPDGQHFDPRAVVQRFDLAGRSVIHVPLTIDLARGRLRWLDAHVASHDQLHQVGGYRAALAHLGKDFADAAAAAARPTLWDLACVHAAARANLVYVRERDGSYRVVRRRAGEPALARLSRLLAGHDDDGALAQVPAADAPTWVALLRDDLAIPAGSEGYVLDARRVGPGFSRLTASDLVAQLAVRPDARSANP